MDNRSKIRKSQRMVIDQAPRVHDEIVFEDLISPLSRKEFFAEYWERKPFVSRGGPKSFFSSLFSIQNVDEVILYQKPKPGHIDLVTDQGFVRDNYLNADQTANINLVYENYLKGCTIILSGLESSWPPLATFCRKLEGDMNHPIGVAVYVTPPNAKGVKPHFDTQEGFLIQVNGSKRWKVYKPVHEFPPVEGSYTSVEPQRLSKPICETVLFPGDVLYIPRGFPHEGIAGDGEASLHITLEIHVRSWLDLMSDALGALADRDVRFRRSAPIGFLGDSDAMSALSEQFDMFKRIFHEGSTLEDALRKHVERLAVKKPPLPDGHFAVLFEKIALETRLRKRHIAVSRQFEENGMVGVQFSGNHIVGPAKIKSALEFIHCATEFAAAELPGELSEKEKLVLVNRLIKIGLLTLA